MAAACGTVNNEAVASGWDLQSFNATDPVEIALAASVRDAAKAHVDGSTSNAYLGPWSNFVDWCASLDVPRCSLPASQMTVAMYLQSVVDRSKSYAPVKSHSAAIACF